MKELCQIWKHIENGDNFLLSGGAGSGKTYTLVQVIKMVIEKFPISKVACMTYTNAAVKEIEDRVNHNNLNVSTIHDFLWDNIKHFQKELKKCFIDLANGNDKDISRFNFSETVIPNNFFESIENGVQYKEYLRLSKGIISHDELLILANRLFKLYPKLNDIIKDRFKFIFIDEYQDTNKLVIDIFLEHLDLSKKKNVIGFFGDSMQSIYEDGIGNLDLYKDEGKVKEVKMEQNRRNPKLIIELANRLRTDSLNQKESIDLHAPNIDECGRLKDGIIKFLYSKNHNDVDQVKEFLRSSFKHIPDFFGHTFY